jgi:GPH family glycoside/pentoside/hexuronide:cation symporter
MEKTESAVHEEPTMCTKKEKIGHAIGVLGHDSAYTLWAMWMTPFLTDIVQLPAAILGGLLAFGRVFDGVNDIMMGSIADRTRSKFGRFRPWLLWAGPLFCLCMALSFLIPSPNMTVRIIYACVMYVVVDVVFTAVDIPFWSLPAAMTRNIKERSAIIGSTQTTSNTITGIIGIVMPLALVAFGGAGSASAYFTLAAIVAVFAATMYLISFKLVKEHVVPEDSEKFSLKLGIKSVVTNRPLLLVQIANAVGLLAMIMRGTFNYYYCQYNLGSLEVMSVLSLLGTVVGIPGCLSFVALSKKVDKKKVIIFFSGLYIAACLVQYFAGWGNLILIYTCSTISSFAVAGFNVAVMAMMSDTIEYGEWKTGQRNEGMITSTRCFVTKLVMAVSGVVVAFIIGIFGYTPGAAQTAQTLSAFHTMMTLVCAGTMLLGTIPLFFYELSETRLAEIMEELKARKAGK